MARKHGTIDEVVSAFVDGDKKPYGAGNVYFENDVLFSYGSHFPMLVKMPHWTIGKGLLLNADRYSTTTSQHQSRCFSSATVQIPFSALLPALDSQAGNVYSVLQVKDEINLLDKSAERWDKTGVFTWHQIKSKEKSTYKDVTGEDREYYFNNYFPRKTVNKKDAESIQARIEKGEVEGELTEKEERRPEACLLEFRGRYFISSMDEDSYFISELPAPCQTVDQAFELLKPSRLNGHRYTRQGEWFFVDLGLDRKQAKKVYKELSMDFVLPLDDYTRSNPHIATRGGFMMDIAFSGDIPEIAFEYKASDCIVSGQVRHPDHKMSRLSKSKDPHIFVALRNRSIGNWSADGRVD